MKQAWVYVLRCQHGKFYVGFTRNLRKRLAQHFDGHGSVFTKRHRPLEVILKKRVNSIKDEFETWIAFVLLYGLSRVGGYNRILCYKSGFKWPF